jgi:hypothetical protein
MFALDRIGSEFAEHASTIAAPAFIVISFCQSVAVLLDTKIPWPSFLRKMMHFFSYLNFDLELTRPECAMAFGAQDKVTTALLMPIFVGGVVSAYASIMLMSIHREHDATPAQRHSARNQLLAKVTSVMATMFTVGAIFLVKSFLRPFDCIENDFGERVMASAPEITCNDGDPDYWKITIFSRIGIAGFVGCLAAMWSMLIRTHRSETPGLGNFAFLADKFEDQYFYWEMVIVVRKVLLMAIFLLFNQVAAVLLATFLTIVCLCLHIAARPFEDAGTDWTEMLSLVAQLITLISGPVYVVLVRPPTEID